LTLWASSFGYCAESSSWAGALSSAASQVAQTQIAQTAVADSSYATQIKSAMDKLNALPQNFSDFKAKNLTAEKLAEIVKNVKEADLSQCPADFKAAYAEVQTSADRLSQTVAKMPSKDSLKDVSTSISTVGSLLGGSSAGGTDLAKITTEVKGCYSDLNTSRVKLADITKKYIK